MRHSFFLLCGAMVFGCGGTVQSPPADGGGADGSGGGGDAGDAGVDLSHLDEPCTNGACPAGLEPITYCGFAGCNNGQLCSCEIRCGADGGACPPGTTCGVISDGPGEVCIKN
jgi:hypothetical protein